MKILNTGKLLVTVTIIYLLLPFYNVEAKEDVKNGSKISCKENNKKDLFQSLMDAHTDNDKDKYSHITECLGRLEIDDSEYIGVFYLVIFSEDDIYAKKIIGLISDVNILLPTDEYMIIYATEKGSANLVKELLDRGARTNVKSFGNHFPIEIAIGKSFELFKLLLENTELNDCELKSVTSNLIFSATPKKARMFKLLLDSLPVERRNSLINNLKKNASNYIHKDIAEVLESYDE